MQWPPTSPGVKGRKFHFVPAAFSTSAVEMPSRSKMIASSFISAMLRSRCVFSITLAASATSIEGARWMPAATIALVDRGDARERRLVLGRHHLRDGLEPVHLVAGIDALGRIAELEIDALLQPRGRGDERPAQLAREARIDRRFEHHDGALLERAADGGAGGADRAQIGAALAVDGRRHRDDVEARARQVGGIAGEAQLRRLEIGFG